MKVLEGLALRAYFEGLDAGEPAKALAAFAPTAVYIRQSMDQSGRPGGGLQAFRGRSAIGEYFDARGRQPYSHTLVACVRAGRQEFAQGFVFGSAARESVTFLARADLDDEDRIVLYFALATSTGDTQLIKDLLGSDHPALAELGQDFRRE